MRQRKERNLRDQINQRNKISVPNEPNDINVLNGLNESDLLWYVIQTKPGDEHRVETHLLNQEIEPFLPLLETHQYRTGK
jgi:hypothetical protein